MKYPLAMSALRANMQKKKQKLYRNKNITRASVQYERAFTVVLLYWWDGGVGCANHMNTITFTKVFLNAPFIEFAIPNMLHTDHVFCYIFLVFFFCVHFGFFVMYLLLFPRWYIRPILERFASLVIRLIRIRNAMPF